MTEAQQQARDSFDLDAAMSSLPPASPHRATPRSTRGQAGIRLRSSIVGDISDDLLREFARNTLGAARCSAQYLDALRVVLGNQAVAESSRHVLEMNHRVAFASQRVMRTIIDQMQAARISFGSVVGLGKGRSQEVQCFAGYRPRWNNPAAELDHRDRRQDSADDARAGFASGASMPSCIGTGSVPY